MYSINEQKAVEDGKGGDCILWALGPKAFSLCSVITQLVLPRTIAELGLEVHIAQANPSAKNYNINNININVFENFWFFQVFLQMVFFIKLHLQMPNNCLKKYHLVHAVVAKQRAPKLS